MWFGGFLIMSKRNPVIRMMVRCTMSAFPFDSGENADDVSCLINFGVIQFWILLERSSRALLHLTRFTYLPVFSPFLGASVLQRRPLTFFLTCKASIDWIHSPIRQRNTWTHSDSCSTQVLKGYSEKVGSFGCWFRLVRNNWPGLLFRLEKFPICMMRRSFHLQEAPFSSLCSYYG